MLLALDTATAWITVGLYDEAADRVLAERNGVGPMKHGELLAPAIEAVLTEAEVDRSAVTGLAVGVGPGPYTGLRVGVVTARTLAYALGVPARGICTLDALAAAAVATGSVNGEFVVTTDARRKELFWAAYDGTGRRRSGPAVDRPDEIPVEGRMVVGAGPELYPQTFERYGAPRDPVATDLARLLALGQAETYDAEPIYLRRPDAVAPGRPKPVS